MVDYITMTIWNFDYKLVCMNKEMIHHKTDKLQTAIHCNTISAIRLDEHVHGV